jgi:hypothetical protein
MTQTHSRALDILAELGQDLPGMPGSEAPAEQPPPIRKDEIERINVDNPAAVVAAMGEVYNALSERGPHHAAAKKAIKHWAGQVQSLRAALYPHAEGKDSAARKEFVEHLLHQSEQWANLKISEALAAEYDTEFDYLDTQRSILQSILKRYEFEANADRFGRGRSQRGVGEEG